MEALWVAACPDEAEDFFAFMTTAGAGAVGPDHSLQIMFGVAGEHELPERTRPPPAGGGRGAPGGGGGGPGPPRPPPPRARGRPPRRAAVGARPRRAARY